MKKTIAQVQEEAFLSAQVIHAIDLEYAMLFSTLHADEIRTLSDRRTVAHKNYMKLLTKIQRMEDKQ